MNSMKLKQFLMTGYIFGKLTYSCTVMLFNLNFTVSLLPSP